MNVWLATALMATGSGRGYGAPYAGQGYSRRGDPSYDRNYDRGFYTNQRYGSQPRPEYGPQYRGPAAGYVEEGYSQLV